MLCINSQRTPRIYNAVDSISRWRNEKLNSKRPCKKGFHEAIPNNPI